MWRGWHLRAAREAIGRMWAKVPVGLRGALRTSKDWENPSEVFTAFSSSLRQLRVEERATATEAISLESIRDLTWHLSPSPPAPASKVAPVDIIQLTRRLFLMLAL